jgi:hypothetical protein
LLASEIFGNSVRHSGSGAPGETVTVAVRAGDGIVRVEVTDRAGLGTPELRPAGRDAEGGRGLQVVTGLATRYGARYRGRVNYYKLAHDLYRLDRLHWVMQSSLLLSLANKHRSSMSKMARKYKATIGSPDGPRKCIQASTSRGPGKKPVVATFGGIPLKRQKNAVIPDLNPAYPAPAPARGGQAAAGQGMRACPDCHDGIHKER